MRSDCDAAWSSGGSVEPGASFLGQAGVRLLKTDR